VQMEQVSTAQFRTWLHRYMLRAAGYAVSVTISCITKHRSIKLLAETMVGAALAGATVHGTDGTEAVTTTH
jgi:hypothetical protein